MSGGRGVLRMLPCESETSRNLVGVLSGFLEREREELGEI